MPKTKAPHEQQMSFRQVDLQELVARRLELEAPLESKQLRLKLAKELQGEEPILERYRLIQMLSREVQAEEEELDRLNRRIRARKPPRGVVGDIRRRLEKAERRKK